VIELDKIHIKDAASIVKARNDIRILAERLKFDSINVTRLATMTSEISREMVKTGRTAGILIGLGMRDKALGLVLLFTSGQTGAAVSVKAIKEVFDDVEVFRTEDGLECIKTFKFLPDPEFGSWTS